MTQKIAIWISIGLTAFILVGVGAVIGNVSQPASPAATEMIVEPTSTEPALSSDMQVLLEREQAYQELIDEANRRLEEAYAVQPNAPTYPITPEKAVEIALQAVPGATLLSPATLVNFEGVMAYEVILDRGTLYIDANTGEVLYNSAAAIASGGGPNSAPYQPKPPSGSRASGGNPGGGDDDDGGGDDGGDD